MKHTQKACVWPVLWPNGLRSHLHPWHSISECRLESLLLMHVGSYMAPVPDSCYPDGSPGWSCWILAAPWPRLAVVTIWLLNQHMEHLFLSLNLFLSLYVRLPLCCSAFQVNKCDDSGYCVMSTYIRQIKISKESFPGENSQREELLWLSFEQSFN